MFGLPLAVLAEDDRNQVQASNVRMMCEPGDADDAPQLGPEDLELQVLEPVIVTGYCLHGRTASGEYTRPGICAYRPEDIGRIAIVYDTDQKIIGIYEILDTGGEEVRTGQVIDIWFDTAEECYRITQPGFVQVVDRVGGVTGREKTGIHLQQVRSKTEQ